MKTGYALLVVFSVITGSVGGAMAIASFGLVSSALPTALLITGIACVASSFALCTMSVFAAGKLGAEQFARALVRHS